MKTLQTLLLSILLLLTFRVAYAESAGTVLITGANRGIGLEYARVYADQGYTVIGTARKPDQAVELRSVTDRIEQLDVVDPDSVAALAKRLEGVPIDILINNAGISGGDDARLEQVDFDQLAQVFAVNAYGPLRVTQALMPNLRAGKAKRIINMSSQLGSIENSTGSMYSYRASKTALNQFTKILSVELKSEGFVCVVLHPGWVQTDMGGASATYTPQESVAGLVKVIEGLNADDNGRFYNFKGEPIPW